MGCFLRKVGWEGLGGSRGCQQQRQGRQRGPQPQLGRQSGRVVQLTTAAAAAAAALLRRATTTWEALSAGRCRWWPLTLALGRGRGRRTAGRRSAIFPAAPCSATCRAPLWPRRAAPPPPCPVTEVLPLRQPAVLLLPRGGVLFVFVCYLCRPSAFPFFFLDAAVTPMTLLQTTAPPSLYLSCAGEPAARNAAGPPCKQPPPPLL